MTELCPKCIVRMDAGPVEWINARPHEYSVEVQTCPNCGVARRVYPAKCRWCSAFGHDAATYHLCLSFWGRRADAGVMK